LSWRAVLRIAQSITAATTHLHARGIMHGDLYAHNILHTTQGDALLGDFGAASFFNLNDAAHAQNLEKIEVRALGCLIEELVTQCDSSTHPTDEQSAQRTGLTQLEALAQQCLRDEPAKRPTLTEVYSALEVLAV
jgi:serine/threonine protein kinase